MEETSHNPEEKRGLFSAISTLKSKRGLLALIAIILLLGIVVRLVNYSDVGYWTDDSTTIPTGLIWFYPHTEYPGFLGHGEPAFGHLFLGAGCMLSGEDFSGVTQMHPNFYSGRPQLIGNQLVSAEKYCFAPIHLFGIIFLIAVAIISYSILGGKGAVYSTAFFSFFSLVLVFSRWIKVDIIVSTFIAIGIFLLWKGYSAERKTRKELVYFSCALAFMGLALAVKFSAAFFVAFSFLIILEKYPDAIKSILKKIAGRLDIHLFKEYAENGANTNALVKNIIFPLIAFFVCFLLPFGFKPSVIIRLYSQYHQMYPQFSSIGFYPLTAMQTLYTFIQQINFLDTALFLFAIFILIRLLIKKGKSSSEKFILYLVLLYLASLFFAQTLSLARVSMPFMIGPALLAGLAFSDKEYSLFGLFRIKKKKAVFMAFIVVYVIFAFSYAYSTAPYYATQNSLLCLFDKQGCEDRIVNELGGMAIKLPAVYLKDKLTANDTYYPPNGVSYNYLRPEEDILRYQFVSAYRQQTGIMDPPLEDIVKGFHPFGRQVRYLIITNPNNPKRTQEEKGIVAEYIPYAVLKMQGKDVVYIYDAYNMTKKQSQAS